MIYKEFKDIYKQVLFALSFLLIIPIIHFTKFSLIIKSARTGSVSNIGYSNGNIFYFVICAFILLNISEVLGSNMFNNENKDNSFEYLFSTPVNKLEILLNKIIPRFIILFFLTLIYIMIFFMYFKEPNMLKNSYYILILPKFLPLWIFFIFLIAISQSIFKQKNWIALMKLLTFLIIFLIPFAIRVLLRDLNYKIETEISLLGYSFIIGFMIVLVIVGSGFFIIYNKIDLREKNFSGDNFSKFVIPVEVFLMILSIYILLK